MVMIFPGLMGTTMHLVVFPANNLLNRVTRIIFGSLFRVGPGKAGNVIGFATVGLMRMGKLFLGIGAEDGLLLTTVGIPVGGICCGFAPRGFGDLGGV
jgi:hypothetical protein